MIIIQKPLRFLRLLSATVLGLVAIATLGKMDDFSMDADSGFLINTAHADVVSGDGYDGGYVDGGCSCGSAGGGGAGCACGGSSDCGCGGAASAGGAY